MANIIDHTYFIRETLIAGVELKPTQDVVCYFIQQYEKEFLYKAMGYEFATLFLSIINAQTPPTSGKWYDIVAGCDFIWHGKEHRWQGLKIPATKQSCIADYVYYWYQRNNFSQTSRVGEVKGKAENSYQHNPNFKMAQAANRAEEAKCDLRKLLSSYNSSNERVYPEYIPQYCALLGNVNVFGI